MDHNTDDLKTRARRAYERGRLRRALLPGAAIPPVASLAFVQCAQPFPSIVCSVALAILVAAMLYRGQDWGRGARAGLAAGLAPFVLPSLVEALGSPALCDLLPWICAAGGVVAGLVLVSRRPVRTENPAAYWITAALVTLLAGTVGCWIAGVAGLAGMAAGLAVGAAPVLVGVRP
jgi:hypothetical protein